ncbi:MAG: hypothetical protein Kow0069_21080 [Promethearchaeota archaeon]
MPKKNPKRTGQAARRRYELRQQYRTESRKWTKFYMGAVFVGVVVVVAVLITNAPNPSSIKVIEDGDVARVHYRMWLCDEEGQFNRSEVFQEQTTEFNFTKGNLIDGFYYELLGTPEGGEKYFRLWACSDTDDDGKDDASGDDCLSYGNPGHALYNTTLYYHVVVEEIVKADKNK